MKFFNKITRDREEYRSYKENLSQIVLYVNYSVKD